MTATFTPPLAGSGGRRKVMRMPLSLLEALSATIGAVTSGEMPLVRDQRRLLPNENDVDLVERLIKRPTVNFHDLICNKPYRLHEGDDLMEQRRSFVDLDDGNLEQHGFKI